MTVRMITVEGELVVWDSEDGFGPDEINVGDDDISEVIARLYGVESDGRGSLGNRKLGRVRLTIERLDEGGPGDEVPG